MQGLDRPGSSKSSQPNCPSGYPREHSVPTFEASHRNNIGMKNIVNNQSCLHAKDDVAKRIVPDPHHLLSSEFKELKPIAAGSTRQASPNNLHSPTRKIITLLDPFCQIPEKESPVTIIHDSLESNLQGMTLRSTGVPHVAPSHFNWSSGYSEPMNSASKSESKGTSLCSRGINCNSGAMIGQKASPSTFPDSAIRNSSSEQERSLTGCSMSHRHDFVPRDMEHPFDHRVVKDMVEHIDEWQNTRDPRVHERQELLRPCQTGIVVQLYILNYLLEYLPTI